jgi:hypothetical protein
MRLRLSDGTTVTGLTEPSQGLKHRIFFGVEEASGDEVAVKVELTAGALGDERRVLEWLAAQGGEVPRVRAAGTLDDSGEFPGAFCLVVDRAPGGRTTSLEGWGLLGRALARLTSIRWDGSGLPVLGHDAFLDLHERRLAELGEALGRDLGASLPALPHSYASLPMVVTHGDPGPGNFVDDGVRGTLVDWEDAVIAPRGLDLGRARFMALIGVGPEGWVGDEPAARAAAAVAGFLAEVGSRPGADRVDSRPSADQADSPPDDLAPPPDTADLEWWLAAAGVQFAHWRWERADVPGIPPWLDAIAVLDSAFPAS